LKNKATTIPASLLAEASDIISRRIGLYFPEGRMNDLERGLRPALREFGFEDPLPGIRWLISSVPTESQIEVLARHLTVGETYFFRDRKCFDFLEERVLPELLAGRRSAGKYIRIWSAGCCTGEEPYSIAILLFRLMPSLKDFSISILGTDINPLFLRKASAGVYGDWSFRDTPTWVREGFFTAAGDHRFELLPELRRRVTFMHHNLVGNENSSPTDAIAAMDLILCRNVLMYLTPGHQKAVIGRLKGCLAQGGWLIVSPSEVSNHLFREFEAIPFQGATFYRNSRKTGARTSVNRSGDAPAFAPHGIITGRQPGPEQTVEENIEPPAGILRQQASAMTAHEKEPGSKTSDPYEEGLFLYGKGLYEEAIEKLKPLLSEEPHQMGKAAALLSRIFANQGKLPEAIDFCEKAISAERACPGHYYLRAIILQEQGKSENAAADLRKTLYLDQDFVPAHIFLGNLALRQGKVKQSARHFRNAVELLRQRVPDEVIPGAEGLTAGRLMEIIKSTGFEDVA
jgi:chemotaxis protein methyltransferase CheR